MTDTYRTTVTMSKINMNRINELVGVFGNTPAAVISRIVEHFFDYGKFDDVLEKLRAKKRELYPPEESVVDTKISNLLKGANSIPLEDFIDYLQVDKTFVLDNIHNWTRKFNIKINKNYIVRSE